MGSEEEQKKENHLEPWRDLKGKVVMVTGASAGLGREFCLDLAKAGCKIVAAARRIDRLKSLCEEINQLNNDSKQGGGGVLTAVAVELDLYADGEAIESSVQKVWDSFGTIHALVNNAGVRGNEMEERMVKSQFWSKWGKKEWIISRGWIGTVIGMLMGMEIGSIQYHGLCLFPKSCNWDIHLLCNSYSPTHMLISYDTGNLIIT
ncbi:hypothetical protein MKW94_029873 [Papaver nudicaule]|uniref:Uncharacterized protein n=1 Tax=Papaver nudicaule TaxID=74823 RepID=A0AA42B1J5_PAPNU|nr:hypothetical protein [Papaver nudicaule]